jgi:hypothetical protein
VDLAEWYAAGRWVGLLEYIDMLPSACRLNEARLNDPEEAAVLAKMPAPDQEWAPRVADFDLHAHIMREVVNEIRSLTAVTIAVAGGKPGDVKPFPAPHTEIDRAIQAAERDWAESFVSQYGFDPADI